MKILKGLTIFCNFFYNISPSEIIDDGRDMCGRTLFCREYYSSKNINYKSSSGLDCSSQNIQYVRIG